VEYNQPDVIKKLLLIVILIGLPSIRCTHNLKHNQSSSNRFAFIYINNWKIDNSAKIATLIKNERNIQSTAILLSNNIFSDTLIKDTSQRNAVIEILNASDINATLLTPDFLIFGIDQAKQLISECNFSCLAANVKDKLTSQTLGQEYLILNLGKARVAVIGISSDSQQFYSRDTNIDFENPAFTVQKILPQIKNRSDFQFVLTHSFDTLNLPLDFIFSAPMHDKFQMLPLTETGIYKLEFGYDKSNNILELKRTTAAVDTLPDDSVINNIINQKILHN